MGCHYALIRMDRVKNSDSTNALEDAERNQITHADGNEKWHSLWKS